MATVKGTNSRDILNGGSLRDFMYGYNGDDDLFGKAGDDDMYGGNGDDDLTGGRGSDYLWGGSGFDIFKFARGDSPSTALGADIIRDWNVAHDFIDMPRAGTLTNYEERSTTATTITAARAQVASSTVLSSATHVFLYNARVDRGYLLSDLDLNFSFETGVVILKAGSASDLGYFDIL